MQAQLRKLTGMFKKKKKHPHRASEFPPEDDQVGGGELLCQELTIAERRTVKFQNPAPGKVKEGLLLIERIIAER